ncbi:hypothetical protein TI04_03300 [Achromatium sp. WMS2]|nr:hypothetical protein TI04_03300 [Achromatium sp. WMS2]
MSRWKASAIHLGTSITVVLVIAGILLATWYPLEYIHAVGGLGLISILAGVDATVGPLLTLIIFKEGKKGLKFDLTVIALVQIIAMGYGLHTMYQARPVFLVFTKDRFELVTAAEIPPQNLADAKYEQYRHLPLTGPITAAVKFPEDYKESQDMLFTALSTGLDYQNFPKYYVPYQELTTQVIAKGRFVDAWLPDSPTVHKKLSQYLRSHNLDKSQVKFVALTAKKHDQIVVIDANSGSIHQILDIDPWAKN